MQHTHATTFSEKILDFYKMLEESEQFFILFLKKMENLRQFFSIFEGWGDNLKKKLHSGKSGTSESKELKLKLVWPKHTNILFIFSILFFRYSNMITFFYCKLIIFVVYVNWALFFSIGLQCMCIEQVKTETNLSCLNKKNCLVKLKNFSCVFMSSAWTNMCGHFVSFFACFVVFPVSDLRKLAPLCTQDVYHLSKN